MKKKQNLFTVNHAQSLTYSLIWVPKSTILLKKYSVFNRLPLDFVSDKLEDAPADFAYSNRTAKITYKETGLDSIWIFQDPIIY